MSEEKKSEPKPLESKVSKLEKELKELKELVHSVFFKDTEGKRPK